MNAETADLTTEEGRLNFLVALDEDLLQGGVILSEWCTFIVREADTAFAKGANLAAILTAVSAIETYLRAEHPIEGKVNLFLLIEQASIETALKVDLHTFRKYRNQWVHVDEPWNDHDLLRVPEKAEEELGRMAVFAVRCLRRTLYENQWI